MGVNQSRVNDAQHRNRQVESFDDAWTVPENVSGLLTMESWTLVDGHMIASFDVNSDFMIIPYAEEITSWIRKLRRARHYSVFRGAPAHIKNSRDAVYAAVCGDAYVLNFAPDLYRRDRDIVMAAVKRECRVFEDVVEEFRADREVALLAVRGNGNLLKHASEALHNDRELVYAAVKTDSNALFLYPQEFWDADLVFTAMDAIPSKSGYSFRSFLDNEKVRKVFDQRQFMMAALEKDPSSLRFASKNLQADKEFVMYAVKLSWKALEYASYELRSDQDIFTAALAQSPQALQFAGDSIKDNYDLVLEVVRKDPQALMFASKKLRSNDVVSATAYASYISQRCKL